MRVDIRRDLDTLDLRLKALLPEEYQETYEEVQPVSMGSAGLKFDSAGNVAWNEIWGSFCDLAMAGGPPHKGKLLEPGSRTAIEAHADRYADVVDEICRGVMMTTLLDAGRSPVSGWIRLECYTEAMAKWLLRAITMENVAVRRVAAMLDLPAAPSFRLEKEIKNVITVIAKTSHYWLEHMPRLQQRAIANLLAQLDEESPLIEPAPAHEHEHERAREHALSLKMADAIHQQLGLRASPHRYAGWLGIECPSTRLAIWIMRALVACNVLSRREDTVLFVPVNPATDPEGETVVSALVRIHGLAAAKQIA
jgi:sirohydrochlorin cobaltochelatase